MDPTLPSTDLSSSKVAGFASGILSSLNSLFSANAMGESLFENLLTLEQGTTPSAPPSPQPNSSSNASSPSTASSDSSNDSNNDSTSIGSLSSLIVGLHQIIQKLKANDNGNSASNGSNTGSTGTSTTNTVTPANTAQQTQNSSTTDDASDTSPSGDSSGTTGPKTLADILGELTALMKYMEKKLAAAQSDGTTTSTTDATDGTNGSTADPLTQLLSMIQLIQQQLAGTAGNTLSASTTTDGDTASGSTSTSPLTAALQDLLQLQKDLKGLMASLQGGTTGSDPTTGNSNGAPSGVTSGVTDDLLATTDQTTGSGKPPLATDDGFFGIFGGVFTPAGNVPPAGSFSPANANLLIAGANSAGGQSSDSSPDMTGEDDGSTGGDSSGLNGLNTNLVLSSGATDGAKSTDPYAFASQLSALRAANGGMTGLPDAVEQVLLQINRGVKDGSDQMTIQLQPAELGKINVKLNISSDGQVQGTIVADNPSTLSMLHKDVRSLERALQEAGLRADPGSLQFSLGGQSGDTSGQTTNNFASNASPDGTSASGSGGTPIDVDTSDGETYYLTPGRVNMKV